MQYDGETGDITITLTGESMITRTMRGFKEERFLGLLDILREADVTFTNAEMLFHNYEGVPREESKGTYMHCAPEIAGDLKWMGIDIVACANNHAFDYMSDGVIANKANLERHGLVTAGTGDNLTAARAPGYFDSPRGRIALVAATDHINVPGGRAGGARPDAKGRPGANVLRVQTVYLVDDPAFETLKRLDTELGFAAERAKVRGGRFPQGKYPESEDEFYFNPTPEIAAFAPAVFPASPDLFFRRASENGRTTEVDAEDWSATLASIREARNMADWIIFSIHSGYHGATANEPPDYLISVAHEAIDNGADIVVGHGPHRDKGIEIYRDKPIFYSLGDFILQGDTVGPLPAEAYSRYGLDWTAAPSDFLSTRSHGGTVAQDVRRESWFTFVPVLRWAAHKLERIELHPVQLGMGTSTGQRGRPVLADEATTEEIFDRLQRCSARFGTKIRRDNGIAVVPVAGS